MATIFDLNDPFAIARTFAPKDGRKRLGHPMADKLARIPAEMLPHTRGPLSAMPQAERSRVMLEVRTPWIEEALKLPSDELGRLIWVLLLAQARAGTTPNPDAEFFPETLSRVTDWLLEFDGVERRARLSDDDLRNIVIRDADRLINTDPLARTPLLWLNRVLARQASEGLTAPTRQAFRALLNGQNGTWQVVDEGKVFGLVGLCRLVGIPEEETRAFRETRLTFLGGLAREARMISELHPFNRKILASGRRRRQGPRPVGTAELELLSAEERGHLMLDLLRAGDLLRHRYWSELRGPNGCHNRARMLLSAYRGQSLPAPQWLVSRWKQRYAPEEHDGVSFEDSGQDMQQISLYCLLLEHGFSFRDDQLEEVVDIGVREAQEAVEKRQTVHTVNDDIARALTPGQIGFYLNRRPNFDERVFERILCHAGVSRAIALRPARPDHTGVLHAERRLRSGFLHLRNMLRR